MISFTAGSPPSPRERLHDWVPIRVYWTDRQPWVDWCYLGNTRFVEPFFDETIEKQFRLPFNVAFRQQTSLDTLVELQAVAPGLPPSGFIFHLSRCGSTLVSQMLAALSRNLVISEAGPIDAVLRGHHRAPWVTDEQRVIWLRAMLGTLGRPRSEEQHFFVKFDSWHIFELPLIRRAYPDVPWIFLYRDPVEVMMSHRKQMGSQMVPGTLPPDLFGLDPESMLAMPLEEYGARVLGHFCEAALAQRDPNGWLVNYQQLPELVWTDLLAHFRLELTPEEIERMREAAQFDAKNPWFRFTNDSAEKRRQAPEPIRQLCEKTLIPLYQRLEMAGSRPYAAERGHR